MPTLTEIQHKRATKPFQKREYRAWNLDPNVNEEVPQTASKNTAEEEILYIPVQEIQNWQFHDRPANELGDIQSLAAEFKDIGQQQPCIVRPFPHHKTFKYELIVGERRWHAARLADLPLKIIVKRLTDSEAALIQASENLNRKGLSDYAQGMSYARLINSGIIPKNVLMEKLNISKQQMSRFLSFDNIPEIIKNSIGDFSKISAGTAEHIKQLSEKGDEYIDAILALSDKLRSGKIGHTTLKKLVEQQLYNQTDNQELRVFSLKGRHLFSWHYDHHSLPALELSKYVSTLLKENKISIDALSNTLQEVIDKMINTT